MLTSGDIHEFTILRLSELMNRGSIVKYLIYGKVEEVDGFGWGCASVGLV